MDFAHALDCAHEVGVLADWGKDWYEARTVLRLENPEVVWRVPEKPISEIIIIRKAYYLTSIRQLQEFFTAVPQKPE